MLKLRYSGRTECVATPLKEDRATAIGNIHKKLVNVGHMVFEICEWTDRHTNGHTHHKTIHKT